MNFDARTNSFASSVINSSMNNIITCARSTICSISCRALLRRYYGRSSEKMDPRQQLLFEGLIDKAIPEMSTDDAGDDESPPPRRKGHGRRRLPADLPREKVIHDLPEDEKPCPCCGKLRHIIGKQTHEQLDYIPAKLKVIEHVRLTYGCTYRPTRSAATTASTPARPAAR